MKKLMLIAFISASAHAQVIIPNLHWNNTELHETGAASAWSENKHVTGAYINKDFDDLYKIEYTGLLFGYNGYNNLSIEGGYIDLASSDFKSYVLQGGYKVIPDLALGLSYQKSDDSGSNDDQTIGISSSYKLQNNYFVGAGIAFQDNKSDDTKYNVFHVGLGFMQDKNLGTELVFKYAPSDDAQKTSEIISNTVYKAGTMQLTANFSYEDVKDADESTLAFNPTLEFEVHHHLQFGFQFNYQQEKSDTTKDTELTYGLIGRFKAPMFNVTAEYSLGDTENINDVKTDITQLFLSASYLF